MKSILLAVTIVLGEILQPTVTTVPEIKIGNELYDNDPIKKLPHEAKYFPQEDAIVKRSCPVVTLQKRNRCLQAAQSATGAADDVQQDLIFFRECIFKYYCFTKHATKDIMIRFPKFQNLINTVYFRSVAKRVQLFFIRYNTWSSTLNNPKFRNTATGKCTKLLYILAARYLYVIYVLDMIRQDGISFGPCNRHHITKDLIVPKDGVCFLMPLRVVTCTSDHDVALLGERSGTLASQFSKFFTEQVETDAFIPGFAKSSEDLFDTNVYAFTLEYAMPQAFKGLPTAFVNEVLHFNGNLDLIVLEIVTAISKMGTYNPSYYTELLSDSGEFNSRAPTKNKLKQKFHGWREKLDAMTEALKSLKQSPYYKSIRFQRQLNMAYEQIFGMIEKYINGHHARNALSEMVMGLMYNVESYHTRGAVRHVVGWTQMNREDVFKKITINDYWVSILENWADTVKEYNRECEGKNAVIAVCLPKISKYFWRMLDAMFAARGKLKSTLQSGLLVPDNAQNTGLRSIMSHWFTEVKRKGLNGIPSDDRLPSLAVGTTNLDIFLQGLSCTGQSKTAKLSRGCMNKIQGYVRKYNRNLFIQLIDSDT